MIMRLFKRSKKEEPATEEIQEIEQEAQAEVVSSDEDEGFESVAPGNKDQKKTSMTRAEHAALTKQLLGLDDDFEEQESEEEEEEAIEAKAIDFVPSEEELAEPISFTLQPAGAEAPLDFSDESVAKEETELTSLAKEQKSDVSEPIIEAEEPVAISEAPQISQENLVAEASTHAEKKDELPNTDSDDSHTEKDLRENTEAAKPEVSSADEPSTQNSEAPKAEAKAVNLDAEKEQAQSEQKSWFGRLREGLSKSSHNLTDGISSIFTKRKLDEETLEELEDLLIMADMGATTSAKICANIAKDRFDKEISGEEIRQALADEICQILEPVAEPLTHSGNSPHVMLVVGVNGNGKTTTIGKLAKQFQSQGQSVMLCAADTFRAAAVEQLQVWGERNNVPVITGEEKADAASVAYRALEQAKAEKKDWLMIDTAGRLHNKANLMAELQKIVKVLKKQDDSTPHSVLQVLDATTGQNAVNQVKTFRELVGVDGMVVTKLDGSAKAGVVVALAEQFKMPIHAIGVGEGIDDLKPFTAKDFAKNLVGLVE